MTNRQILLKSYFLSVILAEVHMSGAMRLFLSAPCNLCRMERTRKELSRTPASAFTPLPFLPCLRASDSLLLSYVTPEIKQLCVVCNYKSDSPWQADLYCLTVPRGEAPRPALPCAVIPWWGSNLHSE